MGVFRSVAGQIQIEITGADIPFIFKRLTRAGIVLYNAAQIDDLTVKASIVRKNLPIVKSVVTTCGGDVKIVHKEGLVFTAKKVFKRPILIFTIALLIFMSIYIPSRIFFVKVEGLDHCDNLSLVTAGKDLLICVLPFVLVFDPGRLSAWHGIDQGVNVLFGHNFAHFCQGFFVPGWHIKGGHPVIFRL